MVSPYADHTRSAVVRSALPGVAWCCPCERDGMRRPCKNDRHMGDKRCEAVFPGPSTPQQGQRRSLHMSSCITLATHTKIHEKKKCLIWFLVYVRVGEKFVNRTRWVGYRPSVRQQPRQSCAPRLSAAVHRHRPHLPTLLFA